MNWKGGSINHLLLHSGVARTLWYTIFAQFKLSWVMPKSVKELFASWWMGGNSQSVIMWKMVPLCLMWCIWRERNARCFEDSSRNIEDLTHFFLSTITWTTGWLAPLVISFPIFLSFSFLGVPLYTLYVLGLHPSMRFDLYNFTYQKKTIVTFMLFLSLSFLQYTSRLNPHKLETIKVIATKQSIKHKTASNP